MNAVTSGNGKAIACDQSGEEPLVILVGGAFQHRASDAATAPLAAHVSVLRYDRRGRGDRGDGAPSAAEPEVEQLEALLDGAATTVLVFGPWAGGVLAVDGRSIWRLVLDAPALVVDGSRPPPPEGHEARLAVPASAGHRAGTVEHVVTQAAELASEAGRSVFRREGEYWSICYEGSVIRLKDTKGLRHLARLLAHPGRELHAVDLEAAERPAAQAAPLGSRDGAVGGEPAVRSNLGDAGELLDATAKAAYKARLDELRAELDEAERFNDPARAARARAEMDFLVGELARAVGLGGRDRRAASHAERARLNATRAIRAAIANVDRADRPLGRHLAATIRTGQYCCYTPDPRVPIGWQL